MVIRRIPLGLSWFNFVPAHTPWAAWDMLGRCTYWCPRGQVDCDGLTGWTCEVDPDDGYGDGGKFIGYCVPPK
jgi:hypothetical protein